MEKIDKSVNAAITIDCTPSNIANARSNETVKRQMEAPGSNL
tara:strand:+ start:255 stop:380 length:126 start_codon:yes stop_codon:yes gene_type:complete